MPATEAGSRCGNSPLDRGKIPERSCEEKTYWQERRKKLHPWRVCQYKGGRKLGRWRCDVGRCGQMWATEDCTNLTSTSGKGSTVKRVRPMSSGGHGPFWVRILIPLFLSSVIQCHFLDLFSLLEIEIIHPTLQSGGALKAGNREPTPGHIWVAVVVNTWHRYNPCSSSPLFVVNFKNITLQEHGALFPLPCCVLQDFLFS